jgi:hypothetical protein
MSEVHPVEEPCGNGQRFNLKWISPAAFPAASRVIRNSELSESSSPTYLQMALGGFPVVKLILTPSTFPSLTSSVLSPIVRFQVSLVSAAFLSSFALMFRTTF